MAAVYRAPEEEARWKRSQKAAAIDFTPELSEKKRGAIHALGMGLENKVLLRFDVSDEAAQAWIRKLKGLKCASISLSFSAILLLSGCTIFSIASEPKQ